MKINVDVVTLKRFVSDFFENCLSVYKPTIVLGDWTIMENGQFQINSDQLSRPLRESVLKISQFIKLILDMGEKSEAIEIYLRHSENRTPEFTLGDKAAEKINNYLALVDEENDAGNNFHLVIKSNVRLVDFTAFQILYRKEKCLNFELIQKLLCQS